MVETHLQCELEFWLEESSALAMDAMDVAHSRRIGKEWQWDGKRKWYLASFVDYWIEQYG